jgi:hypothetical protein
VKQCWSKVVMARLRCQSESLGEFKTMSTREFSRALPHFASEKREEAGTRIQMGGSW